MCVDRSHRDLLKLLLIFKQAFYVDLRTALAYPLSEEKDEYPTFRTLAEYDTAPGAKLSTLCGLVNYLLTDDRVPHINEFNYLIPPTNLPIFPGRPQRTRKIIINLAWTMMMHTIISVSSFCLVCLNLHCRH